MKISQNLIKQLIFSCIIIVLLSPRVGAQPADSVYRIMKKVADWQWKTIETEGWKNPKTDWTNGVMFTGMTAWAKIAPNNSYYQKLREVGQSLRWQIGPNRHFADDYCIAQMYTALYKHDKNPVMIADFRIMADSLVALPHTESLIWERQIHLREWAWCDALYMGPAGLANLSWVTGAPKYRDAACKLWWKTSDYLYDPKEHLFFRDSRYFDQREKNGQKVFWSRGNGWAIAGLVNVVRTMPLNYPDRNRFVREFKEMAERIAGLQQPDGTWHASLLDPDSYPAKETSGTGLFCYALAWGVNQKLLAYDTYYPVIAKAWKALRSSVHADGKLGDVQPIGASPDKVTADNTEVYGVGAFLLAGSEMFKLLKNTGRP